MTQKLRVLNLYAGIGGNRKLWPNNEIEVTAVELNPQIATIYHDFFPNDKVIVADAHQFLLEHFKEFDFIWSSPVCITHSLARFWASKGGKYPIVYPDMSLYQEILFLNHFFKGKYVVENVKSYYEPLKKPQEAGRHYFWANFDILKFKSGIFPKDSIIEMQKFYGIDISKFSLKQRKDQILRNCVHPKLGLHIFNCAFKEKQQTLKTE